VVSKIDGVVTWAPRRVIDLKKFRAPEVVAVCIWQAEAVDNAEDADVVFISVDPSVYMIHLNSMYIEGVSEKGSYGFTFLYTSFYRSRYCYCLDVAKFTLVFQTITTILPCRCFSSLCTIVHYRQQVFMKLLLKELLIK
jgi:hypothetical protein